MRKKSNKERKGGASTKTRTRSKKDSNSSRRGKAVGRRMERRRREEQKTRASRMKGRMTIKKTATTSLAQANNSSRSKRNSNSKATAASSTSHKNKKKEKAGKRMSTTTTTAIPRSKFLVRISGGGGQFTVTKSTLNKLNKLDNNIVSLLKGKARGNNYSFGPGNEGDQEKEFRETVSKMASIVRKEGKPLPHQHIEASNVIIPDEHLTFDEAKKLFFNEGEGAIPESFDRLFSSAPPPSSSSSSSSSYY
jgi:hypothetical protein